MCTVTFNSGILNPGYEIRVMKSGLQKAAPGGGSVINSTIQHHVFTYSISSMSLDACFRNQQDSVTRQERECLLGDDK